MNVIDKVRNALKEGKTVTRENARVKYGCQGLAQVISTLRREGMRIATRLEGRTARYYLENEDAL